MLHSVTTTVKVQAAAQQPLAAGARRPGLSANSLRPRGRHGVTRAAAAVPGFWPPGAAPSGSDGAAPSGGNDGVASNDQPSPSQTGSEAAAAEPAAVEGRPSRSTHQHMPSSLFTAFPKGQLPPEGSTLTPEEKRCDPEVERCRTPIHVWESRCSACDATGTARSYSARGRRSGGHRIQSTCLLCHGLGYVRHSTTRADTVPHVNGTGPHTTIGRPPAPPPKAPHAWSLSKLLGRKKPPRP